MNKHQPGPWKVEVLDNETIIEGPHYTVCTNVSNGDADLIAAAPEMLKELNHLYRILEPALNGGVKIAGLATVNKLALVIAKAEGKIK